MRRQGTDQEENLCKTYVQQKIYVKKSQTLSITKETKDMNRDFNKKNIQAHKTKHTERCSI